MAPEGWGHGSIGIDRVIEEVLIASYLLIRWEKSQKYLEGANRRS